ncbi:hypothetical protein EDC01DRAFT_460677 [Geopyxis carbonaria]|nr:hypothetical protein EDC01DRAFT_460677 [Geopyxis carbonaria]
MQLAGQKARPPSTRTGGRWIYTVWYGCTSGIEDTPPVRQLWPGQKLARSYVIPRHPTALVHPFRLPKLYQDILTPSVAIPQPQPLCPSIPIHAHPHPSHSVAPSPSHSPETRAAAPPSHTTRPPSQSSNTAGHSSTPAARSRGGSGARGFRRPDRIAGGAPLSCVRAPLEAGRIAHHSPTQRNATYRILCWIVSIDRRRTAAEE